MRLNRSSWVRLAQIAEVLAHHGLLWVADMIGLSKYMGPAQRIRAKSLPKVSSNWPDRVRLVLADLGPTYVKLGQLASIRPDILPPALVESLEHLQDDVPPFSFADAVRIMESAWGQSLHDAVAYCNPMPLAAASIGQVHEAQLHDGRAVVIKVRRPGIVERAESDFRILEVAAERAERRGAWARQNRLSDLVKDLVATMRDELDFTVEGHNTDTARQHLANNGAVIVPEVIWPLTRQDVLVMESVGGVKINDGAALRELGLDGRVLAHKFIMSLYQQIFQAGFFHADPHPGNVHVDAQGRLIYLDWGMVGIFSREMRRRSVGLVLGLVQGNSENVADALLAMGPPNLHVDRRLLIRDVDRLRRRYYEGSLRDFHLGQALSDLFSAAQRYELRIPSEYLLLAKAAVTADGVVRALDPGFSLWEMGRPLAIELLLNQVNPQQWVPDAVSEAIKFGQHLMHLPEEFERALKTLSRGEIRIVLEHQNIDRILSHWARLANRLALSFLMGAVVLGLALVVHRTDLDRLAGIPLGEYAFLAAIAVALYLAVGLMTRRRL